MESHDANDETPATESQDRIEQPSPPAAASRFERLLHRPEHAWLAAAVGLHAPRPQPAYVRRTRVSRAARGPGRATA